MGVHPARNDQAVATGRRLAGAALTLDLVGVGLVLALLEYRPAPVWLGSTVVLLLSSVGVWWPRLGVLLLLVRGPLAILLSIGGLENAFVFVAMGGVVVGAWLGLLGASRIPAATTEESTRRDNVWSAVLHLAMLAGIVVVAALESPGAGAALAFLWVGIMWGGVAVHEVGHALGALATGNPVKRLEIGLGLALLRTRRVTVRAVPFVGYTEWEPGASMTSRREALVVAAGPAANLLCGLALSLVAIVVASSFVGIVAATQYFTFLVNLIPFKRGGHGPAIGSDGMRLLRLLKRPSPPPPLPTR